MTFSLLQILLSFILGCVIGAITVWLSMRQDSGANVTSTFVRNKRNPNDPESTLPSDDQEDADDEQTRIQVRPNIAIAKAVVPIAQYNEENTEDISEDSDYSYLPHTPPLIQKVLPPEDRTEDIDLDSVLDHSEESDESMGIDDTMPFTRPPRT